MRSQQHLRASLLLRQVLLLTLLGCMAFSFDFETGNSGKEIIIPTFVPLSYLDTSPRGSDPSLILRMTAMTGLAWFDAIAPYHPTAVGFYTKHSHRLTENTNRNKNIAMLYVGHRVGLSQLPKRKKELDEMMTKLGLNPDIDSTDVNTP